MALVAAEQQFMEFYLVIAASELTVSLNLGYGLASVLSTRAIFTYC